MTTTASLPELKADSGKSAEEEDGLERSIKKVQNCHASEVRVREDIKMEVSELVIAEGDSTGLGDTMMDSVPEGIIPAQNGDISTNLPGIENHRSKSFKEAVGGDDLRAVFFDENEFGKEMDDSPAG